MSNRNRTVAEDPLKNEFLSSLSPRKFAEFLREMKLKPKLFGGRRAKNVEAQQRFASSTLIREPRNQ